MEAFKICLKTANNVSALTFIGFGLFQLTTLLYGYFQKDIELMIGMIGIFPNLTLDIIIVTLIFRFRGS